MLGTYADIALAGYEDSLAAARALDAAVDTLVASPSAATLAAARGGVARGPRSLPTDGGLPFRQRHRRRLGGQGERLAPGRGAHRLRGRLLRSGLGRERAPYGQRDRQSRAGRERPDDRRLRHHPRLARRRASRGGGGGGERRHRLSRHRVPAVGTGSARRRGRRRDAPRHRLRPGPLHRGQLRPAGRIPRGGVDPAGRRSRRDGRPLGPGRRGAGRPARGPERRARGDPHRDGLPLLRGARRRAHEARAPAARSRGGARLLLRQHPQLALLRPDRDPERLHRALSPGRRLHGDRGLPSRTWSPAEAPKLDEELRGKLGHRGLGDGRPSVAGRVRRGLRRDDRRGKRQRQRGGPGGHSTPWSIRPARSSGRSPRSASARSRSKAPTASTIRARCSSRPGRRTRRRNRRVARVPRNHPPPERGSRAGGASPRRSRRPDGGTRRRLPVRGLPPLARPPGLRPDIRPARLARGDLPRRGRHGRRRPAPTVRRPWAAARPGPTSRNRTSGAYERSPRRRRTSRAPRPTSGWRAGRRPPSRSSTPTPSPIPPRT